MYQRPADLDSQPVPFVHDAGLEKCKASGAILREVMAGPTALEVEADGLPVWWLLLADPAAEQDVVMQHQQAKDRSHCRAGMRLSPGASNLELERYQRRRARVKWT